MLIEAAAAGASFRGADLSQALFVDADLTAADCSRAIMQQSILHRARAAGARFGGADLTYADFSHADVTGADFSGATLTRALFHATKEGGAVFTDRSAALGDDEPLARAERWEPTLCA